MITVYIALGSNLGDRERYLDRGLEMLRSQPRLRVQRVSGYYETEPVGGPPGQGKYLNAAAELETDLDPQELLQILLDIEQQLGRVRHERLGPRTLDLDLLLYADLVCSQAHLTVPHPRMHEREFVLQPLAEIAPLVVHPVLGNTIRALWTRLKSKVEETKTRELAGQRILVTGSTSGIGRAIALTLAEAGADVLIHGRRSVNAAEEVASRVRVAGGRSQAILADLSNAEQRRRLLETAWQAWEGLDICINNAGVDTLTGEAAHWPFERKWRELLAVDVEATIFLSRAIGSRMMAGCGGSIINMGWDQAETGMEGDSGQLFAATKGAIMAFSKSLAVSLAPQVRVNCLAPGWIRTRWGENASALWQMRVQRETPLQRWGTPEDVAAAVRWLVSPGAAFITGQMIRINGGAVR